MTQPSVPKDEPEVVKYLDSLRYLRVDV
jgi:hypothetical protein